MPRGGKRWKLQVCSSVYDLLLPPGMKGSKTKCICHFYCLHWWLHTVQYHFFLKFSNTTAGIFSQTLWYHPLHWLHCAISYFSSVGGTYGTRHRQYSYIFEVAESYLTTSPVIVGNGVSFAIFKHSTRCAVIFFYHSFLSLDCHHTLDRQQMLWHKLHSRYRYTLLLDGLRQYCKVRARMVCVGCYLCSNIFRYMFLS